MVVEKIMHVQGLEPCSSSNFDTGHTDKGVMFGYQIH